MTREGTQMTKGTNMNADKTLYQLFLDMYLLFDTESVQESSKLLINLVKFGLLGS